MNRFRPWIIVALAAALTLSIIGIASAQVPTPPSIFTGTVTNADGSPAAAGLSVEAYVGDTNCTYRPVTTYTSDSGATKYTVEVENRFTKDGCGGSDSVINFRIDGRATTPTDNERGGYVRLNLTLGPPTVDVEVRVWQLVRDPQILFLSLRPEGARWADFGTVRVVMQDDTVTTSQGHEFEISDSTLSVPLPGGSE